MSKQVQMINPVFGAEYRTKERLTHLKQLLLKPVKLNAKKHFFSPDARKDYDYIMERIYWMNGMSKSNIQPSNIKDRGGVT